jgi:hypothetical protein
MTWIKNIYWKLKIYSCVLVQRNKRWFQNNINSLQDIWSIIEKERITGYLHRAPVKRVKKEIINLELNKNTGCLLNFDKNDGKFVVSQTKPNISVIKICTDSLDMNTDDQK